MVQIPRIQRQQGVAGAVNIPRLSTQRQASGFEALGQGVAALSDQLAVAENRIQDRKDTVNRARAINQFNTDLITEQTRLQTESDMTDPKVVEEFGAFASQKANDLLGEHGGSADSSAKLTVRLDDVRSTNFNGFSKTAVQQQKGLISQTISTEVGKIASNVGANPGSLEQGIAQIDQLYDDFAPGLSKTEEVAGRTEAFSQMFVAAGDTLRDNGELDELEALTEDPAVALAVAPEKIRKWRSDVITARREADKGRIKGEQQLQEAAAILGTTPDKLSPAQRLRLAGLDPRQGKITLSQRIAEMETALGVPLTQAQKEKAANIHIEAEDSSFGSGLRGSALNILTQNANGFANGTLTPEEDRAYQAAAAELNKTTRFRDDLTGEIQEIAPIQLPFVTEAFTRRGLPVPGSVLEDDGTTTGVSNNVGSTGSTLDVDAPPFEQTIFGMAEEATGPISALQAGIARIPVLGEILPSDRVVQARSQLKNMTNDLVRVLATNPRFAEGERQQIQRELDLDPSVIDTTSAFQNRVIGVDNALKIREDNALKILSSPVIGKAEKRQAVKEFNAISNFRSNLGAPPVVNDIKEAQTLPPGTPVRVKGFGDRLFVVPAPQEGVQ